MRHGSIVAIVIGCNERRERAAGGAAISVRSLPRKWGRGRWSRKRRVTGEIARASMRSDEARTLSSTYCRLGTSFLTVSIMAGVVE
jgi:hypothetical protein